jgi:anti-anti-sigma factor
MSLVESSSAVSEGRAGATRRVVDGTVVWLRGEYDISTVNSLSQTIARAIAFDGSHLVIDLSGVQFMDAATIGVIIRARNELQAQFRSLTLRDPTRFARRVLELCGLTNLLDPLSVDSGTAGSPRASETLG